MTGKHFEHRNHYLDDACTGLHDTGESETGWHVIWTRSNFERIVEEQLQAKDYEVFLPTIRQWSLNKRGKGGAAIDADAAVISVPMFKGYLFVRRRIDKSAYLDISNTNGVVQLLGVRWNRLARIPEEEIDSIRLIMNSRLPLLPYPYLKTGAKVRITRGTLANAQGVLVKSDCAKGLFVVSVAILQKSVAVNVDCADLEPV